MNKSEFSNEFDILYNNANSNQAPGLDEYEKSVFLTKAQNQVILSCLNPIYNKGQLGYDSSPLRQIDFSGITRVATLSKVIPTAEWFSNNLLLLNISAAFIGDNNAVETVNISRSSIDSITINGVGVYTHCTAKVVQIINDPTEGTKVAYVITDGTVSIKIITSDIKDWMRKNGQPSLRGFHENVTLTVNFIGNVKVPSYVRDTEKLDDRSIVYTCPEDDILYILNELITCTSNKKLSVVPITYTDYFRLMSKPFKYPLKYQAWRLLNSDNGSIPYYEVITPYTDTISTYKIRYVKKPIPILLDDFSSQNLSIEGEDGSNSFYSDGKCCEVPEVLHPTILQRAVELATAAYKGTLSDLITLGTSSQTEMGILTTGGRLS